MIMTLGVIHIYGFEYRALCSKRLLGWCSHWQVGRPLGQCSHWHCLWRPLGLRFHWHNNIMVIKTCGPAFPMAQYCVVYMSITLLYDNWIVFMIIHSSFHVRRIYMPMRLMGITHMYTFTARLLNCFKSIELWMYMDVHIAQDWEMLMSLYR
jgi:hypothetical protein